MCGNYADYAEIEEVVEEPTAEVPEPEAETKVTFVCEGCAEEVEEALREALIPVGEVIPGHTNVRVLCDA